MARIPIDPLTRSVKIRNMWFPAENILAAMAETGGQVVSDPDINRALDRAMAAHKSKSSVEPEYLIVEAIPATIFVPKRHLRHRGPSDSGVRTGIYLYFAIPKKFIL